MEESNELTNKIKELFAEKEATSTAEVAENTKAEEIAEFSKETVEEDMAVCQDPNQEKIAQQVGYHEVVEEKLTPEEQKKKENEEYAAFLANPANQHQAYVLASQMVDRVGNNWFTLERAMKKFQEGKASTFQKLKMIGAFGYLVEREGDVRDDRKLLREHLFKIVISKEAKKEAIGRIIQYHKDQVHSLELDLKVLG